MPALSLLELQGGEPLHRVPSLFFPLASGKRTPFFSLSVGLRSGSGYVPLADHLSKSDFVEKHNAKEVRKVVPSVYRPQSCGLTLTSYMQMSPVKEGVRKWATGLGKWEYIPNFLQNPKRYHMNMSRFLSLSSLLPAGHHRYGESLSFTASSVVTDTEWLTLLTASEVTCLKNG